MALPEVKFLNRSEVPVVEYPLGGADRIQQIYQ